MNKVKVLIVNKSSLSLPNYGTEFSAGCDVCTNLNDYSLEYLQSRLNYNISVIREDESNKVVIHPHGRYLFPTGLFVAIPDGYEIQVRPRSGNAIKKGLTCTNSPGTIDSKQLN